MQTSTDRAALETALQDLIALWKCRLRDVYTRMAYSSDESKYFGWATEIKVLSECIHEAKETLKVYQGKMS